MLSVKIVDIQCWRGNALHEPHSWWGKIDHVVTNSNRSQWLVLSFVVGELPHWKGSMGMWGDVGTAIIYLFESMEQILLKLRTTFDISNFEIVMLSTTESESICVCLLSIFGSQLWSRENKCRPLKTQRETESVPIYPVSRRFPGRFGNFRVGG